MSVLVTCPKCQKKLKIEESILGKNIKCPACAAVFATKAPAGGAPAPAKTAPAPAARKPAPPADEDEEEPARRPAKLAVKPPADEDDEDDRPRKPAARAARDDEDDDRPSRPAAKKGRDDDEEEDGRPRKPAAKKGRDDVDEEDDRPRKSAGKRSRAEDDEDDEHDRPAKKAKKKGGAGMVLLIVGGIVLLLCGGCAGLGAYFYYKGKEALTDLQAQMTAPALKPGEQPLAVSDMALAQELVNDQAVAFPKYAGGKLLEVQGTVAQRSTGANGVVTEVIFKALVQDPDKPSKPGKPGLRTVPIYCRFTTPLPENKAADVAVGKRITVRGKLTGWDLNGKQATLNECALVEP